MFVIIPLSISRESIKVSELIELIDGHLYNASADLDRVVLGGCGADLMSDVLASIQPEAVLFTGLCNPQVVKIGRAHV